MSIGANSLLSKVAAEQEDSKIQNSTIYPNPFTSSLNLGFYNGSADNQVDVELFDVSGRMVYNKHFGKVATGSSTLHLDLGSQQLQTGNYFARLKVNGKTAKTWTLIKTKKQ